MCVYSAFQPYLSIKNGAAFTWRLIDNTTQSDQSTPLFAQFGSREQRRGEPNEMPPHKTT